MEKRTITWSAMLGILLIAALAFGVKEKNEKEGYKTALTNDYQRLFYDSKAHIENVEVSLSKAVLSDSKEQNVLLLSQVMQQSNSAQEKLTQMPINQADIGKTTKFLTQVSDYSYALIKDHLNGNDLSDKQREGLKSLSNYSTYLSSELETAHDKFMKGDVKLDTIRKAGKKAAEKTDDNMLDVQLVNLEEEMTKYPELIYDGPFSDQARQIKAKALGDKKTNKIEAQKAAEKFLNGRNIGKVNLFETGKDLNKEATIPSYTFDISPKDTNKDGQRYISVSKTGEKIVWMTDTRTVASTKLTTEQATKKAQDFLKSKGLENMESNYSQTHNNVITINFAVKLDNVTIYPDLIKVKVALDNGEIVGYDALHFLKEHHKRQITKPKITLEQARSKIKYDFEITSNRLAIIPKGISSEVMCYEFKGNYEGNNFIVYINADTGAEEQILRVVTDKDGTLTF